MPKKTSAKKVSKATRAVAKKPLQAKLVKAKPGQVVKPAQVVRAKAVTPQAVKAEPSKTTRIVKSGKARKPAYLPKSDGDVGVQAYIASMEPWQAVIARRIDALVVQHVPAVSKAMRWHCPFYGVAGQGWFLAFAGFQRHIKLSFFKGASLTPTPPIGKFRDVRSLDIREADKLDEHQLAAWIQQAAALPGWDGGSPRSGGATL